MTSQRREVSPSPNGGASLNLPKRAVDKSSSGGCEHGSHRRTVAGYEKADAEREAVVCSPVARRNTGSGGVARSTRAEGFYWVVLGQNPPEVACWERGEWWLAGDAKPWQPEAVTVVSDRLIFRPRTALW